MRQVLGDGSEVALANPWSTTNLTWTTGDANSGSRRSEPGASRAYCAVSLITSQRLRYLQTEKGWLTRPMKNGPLDVYIERFGIGPSEPRRRWHVSSNGGNFPRWRQDGRELFYTSAEGELMSVMIRPGPDSLEPPAPHALFPLPTVYYTQYSYEVAPVGNGFWLWLHRVTVGGSRCRSS